jgi:hypothetical protein
VATKGKRTTRLGAAAAQVMRRRTGAAALAAATGPTATPATKHGDGAAPPAWKPVESTAGYKVTTIRMTPKQWIWLRQEAHKRALASGTMADASEIVRELIAKAMPETETETKTPDRRR